MLTFNQISLLIAASKPQLKRDLYIRASRLSRDYDLTYTVWTKDIDVLVGLGHLTKDKNKFKITDFGSSKLNDHLQLMSRLQQWSVQNG